MHEQPLEGGTLRVASARRHVYMGIPLAGPLTQSNIDNIVFVKARRSLNPKNPK